MTKKHKNEQKNDTFKHKSVILSATKWSRTDLLIGPRSGLHAVKIK